MDGKASNQCQECVRLTARIADFEKRRLDLHNTKEVLLGIELETTPESILPSPWMQVMQTIEQQDVVEFEKAYKFTLGSCDSCHKAADKPRLRPQVPQRPMTSIINFDPPATWPE